jgi:hypothetical protein
MNLITGIKFPDVADKIQILLRSLRNAKGKSGRAFGYSGGR